MNLCSNRSPGDVYLLSLKMKEIPGFIPSFFSSIQQAITEHLTIQQLCIEDTVVKKSWEVPSSYALYVLLWETEINSLNKQKISGSVKCWKK